MSSTPKPRRERPPLYDAEQRARRDRTVNDLFLAAISVGMHHYHEAMGNPISELRMNMPISLRTSADQTTRSPSPVSRSR